jgi:hypothetical protein
MTCVKIKLYSFFLMGIGLSGLQAQESIIVSGNNGSGSGGSMSYSIGQIVYTLNKGTNGSMAQGVQQAFEISFVTGITEAKGIRLQCSAYPNPARDILVLKIDASTILSIQSISYQLCNINGKVLETKNLINNETSIFMMDLLPGTYFLKVIQSKNSNSVVGTQNFVAQREIKTFKIIKY